MWSILALEVKMAQHLKACFVACKVSWTDLQALCRRARVACIELEVNKGSFNEYEVEYVADYMKQNGKEYFLIKWKGYSESENTWEPRKNLKCPKLLKVFMSDLDAALRRPKERWRFEDSIELDQKAVGYLIQKAKQRQILKCWETRINKSSRQNGRIYVQNDVDLEGMPQDFTYIDDYRVGEGVEITPTAVGCECKDCFRDPVAGCCPGLAQHRLAYTDRGVVRVRPGEPIYECNSRCRCGPDCINRVVQRGIQYDLCIFRTDNGRGWGVRTLDRILKNTFVMEYLGEIITTEEAERRGEAYDSQGATYLFDLDYVEDVFTVDAANYGNVSHFVNHSCEPNLQVYNVFIDNLDERLPRIVFFATRYIKAGEELTFDYKMQIDPVDAESSKMDFSLATVEGPSRKRMRVECKCGVESCRKYLF
ncbi:histone-lysine N-methyltransferase SUV39H1-A isoform X2 [Clupea harengus]|uniref:Histone-lysine N-methyltransferase n=1 Tax=Clupea harengus TaxID=7950 RepID=A0A6P3VUA9_CLUHA|nr:histone-lysine N-methyltransferase SUV39H1-A isoform X2 [Clupea harengus]